MNVNIPNNLGLGVIHTIKTGVIRTSADRLAAAKAAAVRNRVKINTGRNLTRPVNARSLTASSQSQVTVPSPVTTPATAHVNRHFSARPVQNEVNAEAERIHQVNESRTVNVTEQRNVNETQVPKKSGCNCGKKRGFID